MKKIICNICFILILNMPLLAQSQSNDLPDKYSFTHSLDYVGEALSEERGNLTLYTKIYYTPGTDIVLWKPTVRKEVDDEKDFGKEAKIFDMSRQTLIDVKYKDGSDVELTDLSVAPSLKELKVEKTKVYEDIQGFKCQKILYTAPETEFEVWVTQSKKIKAPNFLKAIVKSPNLERELLVPQFEAPEGFPMRLRVLKNRRFKGATITFTVTSFNEKDSYTYDLSTLPKKEESPEEEELDVSGAAPRISPIKNNIDLYIENPEQWLDMALSDKVLLSTRVILFEAQGMDLKKMPPLGDATLMVISNLGDPDKEALSTSMSKRMTQKISEMEEPQIKSVMSPRAELGLIRENLKGAIEFENGAGTDMNLQFFMIDTQDKRIFVQVLTEKEYFNKYSDAVYNTLLSLSAQN